jgi:amino acid transporter
MTDPNAVSGSSRQNIGDKPSILRAIKMVAWSFLGIRKNSEYKDDLRNVSPLHVILVGLVLALLFIGALLLIVRSVAT